MPVTHTSSCDSDQLKVLLGRDLTTTLRGGMDMKVVVFCQVCHGQGVIKLYGVLTKKCPKCKGKGRQTIRIRDVKQLL